MISNTELPHYQSDGFETVRLWRRQTQGHQSSDVFHPRRCRRCTARSHRGNVPPEGRRDPWRHAAALGVEIGNFARHNTRYADEPHVNDRPDGERLSRCQAPKAIEAPDSTADRGPMRAGEIKIGGFWWFEQVRSRHRHRRQQGGLWEPMLWDEKNKEISR